MPFPGSCSLYGVKFKTYWYVHCLSIFHQCSLDSPDLSAQEDSTRTINTEDTQEILCQQGWFRSMSLTLISSWYSLTVIHNTLSDYQTGWWDNRFCSNTTVWVSGIGSLTRKAIVTTQNPLAPSPSVLLPSGWHNRVPLGKTKVNGGSFIPLL